MISLLQTVAFLMKLKPYVEQAGKWYELNAEPEPEWFNDARSMNKGPTRNTSWALSKHRIDQLGVHASETAWVGQKFDVVLNNSGTIEELYQQIEANIINNQVQDRLDAILNPLGQFHTDN
jgi:hypothetical protein